MILKCAECQCTPMACSREGFEKCANCTKGVCCSCCIDIHPKEDFCSEEDACCSYRQHLSKGIKESLSLSSSSFLPQPNSSSIQKRLYAAAVGIEILCIADAEIGETQTYTCLLVVIVVSIHLALLQPILLDMHLLALLHL